MQAFTGNKQTDLEVLKLLSYEDVLQSCRTNKYLAALCRDDNTWRLYLQNKFPSIVNKHFLLANGNMYFYPTWRNYADVIFTNSQVFEMPMDTVPARYSRNKRKSRRKRRRD